MHIKKIEVKDYKRFHDLTIDLGDNPKRIIALVGPNGCGKSSIFDAMLFLNNTFNRLGYGSNKDYKYHSLMKNPSYNHHSVNIEFTDGKFMDVFKNRSFDSKEKTIFSFRSAFRYNNDLKIHEITSVEDIGDNNYGASNASEMDQRIVEGYRRLLAYYNKYQIQNDARPSETRKHIIGELNASLKKCLDLEIVDIGNVESDRGTLYFKKNDADIEFEYNVLSAGEKEVVDIILDLYLRKTVYDDSIYIIDEPELHLNTAIQKNLLLEINKIIPDNCQIWIATHSIGFLEAIQNEILDNSQIIKFDSNNKWASEKYILKPSILSRKEWQEIFSTALDDLANLVCPKTIVYCEGLDKPRNDGTEQGFDAIVYNKIFNKKYPNVLFVSSGGNTELDQRSNFAIMILSKALLGIEILVLKDMDMNSGKNVDLEIRNRYLKENPSNHRVLKRFEIENYLYDSEVLKKYCKVNSLIFDSENYNLVVKDIINNNVKDLSNKIKFCCGLGENYNVKKFKNELAELITEDMDVYKELDEVIFNKNVVK